MTPPVSASVSVSAVLFDLDRTLIDLERATRLGIDAHLTAVGLPSGPEAYEEWKRLEVLHVRRFLDGHATLHGQRRDRVREMTGSTYTDDEADAWFAAYRVRMEAELQLFEDTMAALAHIGDVLQVPVGIVTNMTTDYQLSKMTAVGLPVERSRVLLIVAAVGLLAFGTAAAGPIAFVSFLAGPIAVRLLGPVGSPVLPAGLVGALLVLVADYCAQFAFGTRLPVGVITGVLGAPYLIYLLVRSSRSGGTTL